MPDQMKSERLTPHRIVENARKYILVNMTLPLSIATVAKGIKATIQDLRGSYLCCTPTSLELDLAKIRLQALFKSIKVQPAEDLKRQIASVGLEDAEHTYSMFENEFWISIHDHQRNCLGLNR